MSDNIVGVVSVGRQVVNEYVLSLSENENGYRLTIQKGTEVQTMDFRNQSEAELQAARQAEQGRADAEARRVAEWSSVRAEVADSAARAENAAASANAAAEALGAMRFYINDDMELEVSY